MMSIGEAWQTWTHEGQLEDAKAVAAFKKEEQD